MCRRVRVSFELLNLKREREKKKKEKNLETYVISQKFEILLSCKGCNNCLPLYFTSKK